MNRSFQALLDKQREKIDREWEERIANHVRRVQAKIDRFISDADAVEDEELPSEEYSAVFQGFYELVRLGVRFSPAFVQRIAELRKSVVGSDVDADLDMHDEYLVEETFTHRIANESVGLAVDGND